MSYFNVTEHEVYFTTDGEVVRISACGSNSIRFQASPTGKIIDQNWNLMPQDCSAKAYIEQDYAVLETGNARAIIYSYGKVEFYHNGKKVLEEKPALTFGRGYRNYVNKGSNLWRASVLFAPQQEEHFYGLGHEENGCFDLKGCSIDLMHLNSKCSIPYLYSSLGYGFLWNSPATGLCELTNNRTRWTSHSTKQIDYVFIGGTPKEVTAVLADLTGHAPQMPEWALGFWQSRLRYETQEEVLSVARRYKELNIPVSVMVIDFFHWTEQGDYKFDPKYWPDPKAMADELHDMGIKLMVSMWPTINEKSENYHEMVERNMLLRTTRGSNCVFNFLGWQAEIDVTNPETREFVWSKLKENYIDNGVDCLWFDEAEPEIHPEHFDNIIMSIGNGDEVGLLYPYYYAQLVYDGMKAIGREDIVTLTRCGYLGCQKFGALIWSGDIESSFRSLGDQVKSGLNMSMCGIPWWTTDIGGFYGGDTTTDTFRELIVRWFQYGVFCPVTRLHGSRLTQSEGRDINIPTGGDNELWSFGDYNFDILKDLVLLRERLKPYIQHHMDIASQKGYPVMRPMFFDFPDDSICYSLGEQYMFGDDILFAPVVNEGQTQKSVYLPEGNWVLTKDKHLYTGQNWYEIEVPIDTFIAFVKEGADILNVF